MLRNRTTIAIALSFALMLLPMAANATTFSFSGKDACPASPGGGQITGTFETNAQGIVTFVNLIDANVCNANGATSGTLLLTGAPYQATTTFFNVQAGTNAFAFLFQDPLTTAAVDPLIPGDGVSEVIENPSTSERYDAFGDFIGLSGVATLVPEPRSAAILMTALLGASLTRRGRAKAQRLDTIRAGGII